ncbi:MAG: hypothetical protein Q9225_002761 [Loekoesia sp. 1 TL-2023]
MATILCGKDAIAECIRLKTTINTCLEKQKFTLEAVDMKKIALGAAIWRIYQGSKQIPHLAISAEQKAELRAQHSHNIHFHQISLQSIAVQRPKLKLFRKALKRGLFEIRDCLNYHGVFLPADTPAAPPVPRFDANRAEDSQTIHLSSMADLIREAEALVSEVDAFLAGQYLPVHWRGLLWDLERMWPLKDQTMDFAIAYY